MKLVQASGGTTSSTKVATLQNESASFASLNVSGMTNLTDLTVKGSVVVAGNLTVQGLALVQDVQIEGTSSRLVVSLLVMS